MTQKNNQRLMANYQRRLQKLKEQQATRGLDTPPHVLIEIEDLEAAIAELQTEWAALAEDDDSGQKPLPTPKLAQDFPLTTLIQIQLPDEKYLSEKKQKILVDTIGGICQLPPDRILLRDMKSGLWIGLEMPEASAEKLIKLFKTNDQGLGPLRAQFRVGQISLTTVQPPPTGLADFGPEHLSLVQLLYLGAEKVLIEKPLGGGYGGAQVLLAQPIYHQGRPAARQIIKIGKGSELQGEYDNSVGLVEKDLPLVAARVDNYAEYGGLAGISYTFMGGGILGHTRTLEAYYQDSSVEEINQTLAALLEEALGQSWYRHTQPHLCFFADEYGAQLVEYLRLRLRPASSDGIWPADQPSPLIAGYEPLAGEGIASVYQNISAGTLVQIAGLMVSKVKAGELKLQHPAHPGIVVKVERRTDQAFAPGDKVFVRGEVVYNRQQRLAEIVKTAFTDFTEAKVEVNQARLTWGTDYPNPLHLYPQVLNQILPGKKSTVHGDLHLRNVLVDQQGRAWLIDFALVTERHNLYDFIKLETYIRQMILNQAQYQFSFVEYLQFEAALAAACLGQPAAAPEQAHLRKAYLVIRFLRELAAHYMGHPADFHSEYLPALFLYNLAVLKYHDNHGDKAARLAFATAVVVGRALTEPQPVAAPRTPESEPPPAQPIRPDVIIPSPPSQQKPALSAEDEQFLREQLVQHEQNRRHLLKQKSMYGAGEEPLRLLNQIRSEEEEIKKIKQQLGQ